MNRTSKRTDRRALISGVEVLEGRKLMAAGLMQNTMPTSMLPITKDFKPDAPKPKVTGETVQLVTGPYEGVSPLGPQREMTDLKLKSANGVRGTGSFDLSASSPLVTTLKKEVAAGHRSVEVEIRLKKADGMVSEEVLDLHLTKIVDELGPNGKVVTDHVEFTFVNPKAQDKLDAMEKDFEALLGK